VIAVAGDVDPDAVAHGSRRGSRRSTAASSSRRAAARDPPREIRRAELIKNRAQAHLVIGSGVSVADEDRFALE